MTRPRLLDLFCSEGGTAMGYHRAGFDVVGVDIRPQPRFPFEFVQADALEYLEAMPLDEFDAIHASPTCQSFARVTDWRGDRDNHPDLLTPTLALLRTLDIPWIVENVPEAVAAGILRPDFMLCGSMFALNVRRHRAFETNWPSPPYLIQPCHHRGSDLAFEHKGERAYADALGCDWMTNRGGRQAIPPAYTQFIGERLLTHLAEAAA